MLTILGLGYPNLVVVVLIQGETSARLDQKSEGVNAQSVGSSILG